MTVTNETTPISHYERIGGAAAVRAAVELFYGKVLADGDLAGYFAGVDMAEQRRHMALMLAVVLGGPNEYAGRGLAEAHQPSDVAGAHYARVGEHLTATFVELGAPAEVIADVQVVLGQVREQVVSAGDA
ncbi:group 1 truncated hemoglobin [Micromonospora sp. NPDC050980]|uniref:group I truncated hemoglobin n=1 Tax=Micromonospora sp. NPDC050980 TaxID=3155161 RepID=UPI0033F927AE